MRRGKVYLVGAGPGDPGLLTLRGRELLETADLIVYDALANPALLDYARPGARKVFAGRRGRDAAGRQRRIDALLKRGARRGWSVVRLKGGDPFLFGRGGEEAETLAAAGIGFEIVPGVSSAMAAAAYAGIPLTHRRHASSILVATGHEDPRRPSSRLRWEALARGADTLVFLMAIRNLRAILRRLVRHGRPPSTPAAVVEWGTWPRQRVVTGTLADLAERAKSGGIGPPALLVVGKVVRLRRRLAWFERRPLFGRRIVVTRPRGRAGELARRLAGAGAEVIEFPMIQIAPPLSWKRADAAIRRLAGYGWILFTSASGVEAFLRRLERQGRDLRALAGAHLGAIGPATARALEERGLRVDLQPGEYRAEAVAAALRGRVRGCRVLIPRARVARDILPALLEKKEGAKVEVVEVYRTLALREGVGRVRRALRAGSVDAVTFTSSSTVHNFIRALSRRSVRQLLKGVALACIGPVTAATLRSYGLRPRVQPAAYTAPALAVALCAHFRNSRAGTRRPR